ncbi:MAG: CDGSH iron-sulfur domain-containing protein [Magnetococcales bacterium]|nr:CDGSH iron-sulfur domain-containing protein [Magnetococcales bacterium]
MSKMYENKKNYTIKGEINKNYSICLSGQTKTPPFCDGSHKKNSESNGPYIHKCKKNEDLFICGCGGSTNKPWCDGSHQKCPEHDDYMKRW